MIHLALARTEAEFVTELPEEPGCRFEPQAGSRSCLLRQWPDRAPAPRTMEQLFCELRPAELATLDR